MSSPSSGRSRCHSYRRLTDSTVTDDSAMLRGGGIYNDGTVTVTDSTLSGNSAILGGGIYNDSGTMAVTNSTLSGNTGTDAGGGIEKAGALTMTDSTLSSNAVATKAAESTTQAQCTWAAPSWPKAPRASTASAASTTRATTSPTTLPVRSPLPAARTVLPPSTRRSAHWPTMEGRHRRFCPWPVVRQSDKSLQAQR